jgi:hypothetical protein
VIYQTNRLVEIFLSVFLRILSWQSKAFSREN